MSAVSKYYTESAIRIRTRRIAGPKTALKINWKFFFGSLVITGFILFLILYLCNCAKLVDLQYRVSELEDKKLQLTRELDGLELKTQNLKSFERIQYEAEKRLSMVKPEENLILNVSSETFVTSAGNCFAMEKSSNKN